MSPYTVKSITDSSRYLMSSSISSIRTGDAVFFTELMELGIPVVIALNKSDLIQRGIIIVGTSVKSRVLS